MAAGRSASALRPRLSAGPRPEVVPELVRDPRVLQARLQGDRLAGRTVGLVPTMGALHRGHLSLVLRAAAECDVTAVTIFVNPLQFGPGEDLAGYPHDLAGDLLAAGSAGASVVLAPDTAGLWPAGRPEAAVTVDGLGDRLEGASRPGHFTGVATVVTNLFNLAGPCRAYFGEKDFQQLTIVRRLVTDLAFPVEVVACPTVREADGLACSSRNVLLSAEERRAAPVLHAALSAAVGAVTAGERRADVLRALMAEVVACEPRAALDYADVVDPVTLAPLTLAEGAARLVIAARLGAVRLIDNLAVPG